MTKVQMMKRNEDASRNVVYVLVSNQADYYAEMLYLSIAFLKRYSPGILATVLMDVKTSESFTGMRKKLLAHVDEIKVVPVAYERFPSGAHVSRYIKTSMRQYVSGLFLYVDIDAYPVASLESLFSDSSNVAMAFDCNSIDGKFELESHETDVLNAMGWSYPHVSYNSGVMLVPDTKSAHSLFGVWNALWQESCAKGFLKDQPALHEAIKRSGVDISTLNPQYNILIGLIPNYLMTSPKIYHVSTIRFEERADTKFHSIIRNLKHGGESVDWVDVDEWVKKRYPWTNLNSVRLAYISGNYRMCMRNILKKIAHIGG